MDAAVKSKVSIYDAKARLSELVSRVELGGEVVITKRGKPVARIVRAEPVDDGRRAALARFRASVKKNPLPAVSDKALKRMIAYGRR